ncbi:DUF4381 domain-containing protein [Kangiella marina]|uniref:DUF4381 domain-containing protein n=1 Tax=Kangiella marina TaxID=1079178 RepID=A0ABP8IFH9_9GAMM
MNMTFLNSAQSQLLEQLRDIHTPETVSWWPLAIGWWVVIGLVVLILVLLLIKTLIKKHHYRYVRFATSELKSLANSDEPRWLAKCHNIMRRLCLCYGDEALVSSLSQAEWLRLLQSTNQQQLSQDTLDAVVDLPYKPVEASESLNKALIINEVIGWASDLPEQIQHYPQSSTEESAHV